MKKTIIFFIAAALLMVVSPLICSEEAAPMHSDSDVILFAECLGAMPAWASPTAVEVEIEKALRPLMVLIEDWSEDRYVRVLAAYFLVKCESNTYTVEVMSKLYVLNRIFFNVSPKVPRDKAHFFGGFAGVPQIEENFNYEWPVEAHDEIISIKGIFSGYAGDLYLVVDEAKWLKENFGKRGLKNKRLGSESK